MRRVTKREQVAEVITKLDAFPKVCMSLLHSRVFDFDELCVRALRMEKSAWSGQVWGPQLRVRKCRSRRNITACPIAHSTSLLDSRRSFHMSLLSRAAVFLEGTHIDHVVE